MELSEKEREIISTTIFKIIEERGIKVNPEWEDDFPKEHDFECLLLEIEQYLDEVARYEEWK